MCLKLPKLFKQCLLALARKDSVHSNGISPLGIENYSCSRVHKLHKAHTLFNIYTIKEYVTLLCVCYNISYTLHSETKSMYSNGVHMHILIVMTYVIAVPNLFTFVQQRTSIMKTVLFVHPSPASQSSACDNKTVRLICLLININTVTRQYQIVRACHIPGHPLPKRRNTHRKENTFCTYLYRATNPCL